jgi:hypothetical protein
VLLQSIGAEIVELRSLDDELTRFEPEYALHKGSTENSYLIQVRHTQTQNSLACASPPCVPVIQRPTCLWAGIGIGRLHRC